MKKKLHDLEPRKSQDSIRGGRLALESSSVKVATQVDLLGKKQLSAYKVRLPAPKFKWL